MKYDCEQLLDNLVAYLKAELNNRISALNSEKNDSIVLSSIDEDSWFFESLDDENHNKDPFVFYHIDSSGGKFAGPNYTKVLSIEFVIFLIDSVDGSIQKRVLRYTRALEEALASAWNKVRPLYNGDLETIDSIDVIFKNSSYRHKCFGAKITFDLS